MGNNGGFNPFRDANGEFSDPGSSGKAGRSRAGGPLKWVAAPKTIGPRAPAPTPSAAVGEARQPTRQPGSQTYTYPKSTYTPEAKATGTALNAAEQRHAARLLQPGVPNTELVAGSKGSTTMATATALTSDRRGAVPWMSFRVLDPATKGTTAEKWLEIPRGEQRDPKTGRVTGVVSEAARAKEFVAKVNAGADFQTTLKAFNGGKNPIDSANFGPPTSQRDLAPFNAE